MFKNGLVVSAPNMSLLQTQIRFLGHEIVNRTIRPIQISLEFANKFLDEIKDKTQLQRFLGCVNYVHDFFKDLGIVCKPLYQRLKKKPEPWIEQHTKIVQHIKEKIKYLPCLNIPQPNAQIIVEIEASDLGFGGILKQKINDQSKEEFVRFFSGAWNDT